MSSISLLEKVSSEACLLQAWKKLNKSYEESKGLSGLTIESFGKSLETRIPSISSQLKSHKYRFSPNRAVVIQKDNGKFRPLQIPEIHDRVVLKAIAIELEIQLNHILKISKGVSFAYQKKLGVKDAIDKMTSLYKSGNKIILEADIINFFGEVDKKKLLQEKVFSSLTDDSLNNLLEDALNQKVGGLEKLSTEQRHLFDNINTGIPQGNALSPLLSNIYLSSFDKLMIDERYNLVRYADDFIVLCKNKNDANSCYLLIKEFLDKELKLRIHPIEEGDKTRILDPTKDKFSFLSIEFDGNNIYPSEKNLEKFRNKLKSICHDRKEYPNILSLLLGLRNCIDGWVSAFFYTKIEKYEFELEQLINRHLYLALADLGWKFTSRSLSKVKLKFRLKNQSNVCLSLDQRINSGVPLIKDLVLQKRSNNSVS
jgi:RNA-directed DNA polymerase